MQGSYTCTVCGNGGHTPSKCKSLGIPPEGFFTGGDGGDGGGGHGGDEEDDSIAINASVAVPQQQQNGSAGDESQPTPQVLASAPHNSPNTPSNVSV
jgi:hypothetical protein